MGRIVTFGISVNNQSEVCDESRLSLGLDDRASETSPTSSGDLGFWADEDVMLKWGSL